MLVSRSEFLEALIKASADLGTVFLNQSGSPTRMLSDLQVIELLATKKSFKAFRDFALAHPLVSKIDIITRFRRKEVWLELTNGTELHFMFYHDVITQSLSLINVKEFLAAATVNEFGMLTLPNPYQYEYLTVTVQFTGMPLADRYKNYFSALDGDARRALFTHMQSRYDLVMSVIEDLYEPNGKVKYSMMVGLRHAGRNSLLMLMFRIIKMGVFGFLRIFTPRSNTLIPDPGQQKHDHTEAPSMRKAQNY